MNSDQVSSEIWEILQEGIDELNLQRDSDIPIKCDPEQALLSGYGVIDSLGFAFLIVILEQTIEEKLSKEVTLFDDDVLNMDVSDPSHPFNTVLSLANHIESKVKN